MDKILAFMRTYFDWFYITTPDISDIIEILILSYVIYKILMWFKSNRAWTLLKGIVLILLFTILASLFQFNTILYILKNVFSIGILAVIILFQPEFRRGLETLGRKKFFDYYGIPFSPVHMFNQSINNPLFLTFMKMQMKES
jgi:diadenylate cyclase